VVGEATKHPACREDEWCAFHVLNAKYALLIAVSSAGRIKPDVGRISPP